MSMRNLRRNAAEMRAVLDDTQHDLNEVDKELVVLRQENIRLKEELEKIKEKCGRITTYTDISSRRLQVTCHIDEAYLAMCADAEIPFRFALKQCVDELRNHKYNMHALWGRTFPKEGK